MSNKALCPFFAERGSSMAPTTLGKLVLISAVLVLASFSGTTHAQCTSLNDCGTCLSYLRRHCQSESCAAQLPAGCADWGLGCDGCFEHIVEGSESRRMCELKYESRCCDPPDCKGGLPMFEKCMMWWANTVPSTGCEKGVNALDALDEVAGRPATDVMPLATCEEWYKRSCNVDDPRTQGDNCEAGDQCEDGSCKGGHCCAYSGRLAECTSCDSGGDCSSCSSGHVLSSSYECQKERTCLSAVLACRACGLPVIHNCPGFHVAATSAQ